MKKPVSFGSRMRICKRRLFTKRSPWIAFVLTQICPGWGQIYNRDYLWVGICVFLTVAADILCTNFLFDTLSRMLWAVGLGLLLDTLLSVQAFIKARRVKRIARPPAQRRWWRMLFRMVFVYGLFAGALFAIPEGYGLFMPTRAKSYQIPSESMVPNLLVGDYLVADGWSYWHHDPKRGDVIVFLYPKDHSLNYVKRLIGLPGDTVELRAGVLFINGKEMPQKRTTTPPIVKGIFTALEYSENLDGVEHTIYRTEPGLSLDFGPVTVPPGRYFMMGDNRDRSSDSRVWGFASRAEIEAKMSFIWFSYDKSEFDSGNLLTWLDLANWRRALRRERIGMQVH